MKTRFYKILYRNKDVVYVGVTTRSINARFREHISKKRLNPEIYSIIQIDEIEHPEINSFDIFHQEHLKVKALEQKYIKEELDKGSPLLNLSIGGEWGTHIANSLLKEKFLETYGSYDGFRKWKNKIQKIKTWIITWINSYTHNKTKVWIRNWISSRTTTKTKVWITSWITHKTTNKTKQWLRCWILHRTQNKTKVWIRNWIVHRKNS